MKASVSKIQNQVCGIVGKTWRGATEYLAFTQWHDLWNEDLETLALEDRLDIMKGCVELNSAHHSYRFSRLEVPLKRCQQMRCIDADIHKDIQCPDLRNIDRDQAAVGIVHQQVAPHCSSGVVIDTASSISDITHDQSFCARAELSKDIGNGGRK